MALRAFPVVFASDVEAMAGFYERLGFARHFQMPPDGPAGYVALRRDTSELAVVERTWPADQYGIEAGDAPTSEMFVYVDDVDATFDALGSAGLAVLKQPEDMPWGERVAYVRDPDGNPVAIAAEP